MTSVNKNASRAKTIAVWALIAVNALLAMVLVFRHTPDNQARAAAAQVGDVLAVPGQLAGFSNGVVFLVDTRGQKLTAISVNSAAAPSRVEAMRPIDLEKVFGATKGGR